jgi:hypothetical protein
MIYLTERYWPVSRGMAAQNPQIAMSNWLTFVAIVCVGGGLMTVLVLVLMFLHV